jgi:Ca2+-binding RTX toxin-like protein
VSIPETVTDVDGITTFAFGPGITPTSSSRVVIYWHSGAADLRIYYGPYSQNVVVPNGYTTGEIRFAFSDGGNYSFDELLSEVDANGGTVEHIAGPAAGLMVGTAYADEMTGDSATNSMNGGAGNDVLWGYGGDDQLLGDSGDDLLYGGAGNDLLDGGAGDDVLDGASGDDIYVLDRGYGNDVVVNETVDTGTITIRFGAGVSEQDVVVSDDRKDRVYTIADTGDSLRIQDLTSRGQQLTVLLEFQSGSTMLALANADSSPYETSSSSTQDAAVTESPLHTSYIDRRLLSLIHTEAAFRAEAGGVESWDHRQDLETFPTPIAASSANPVGRSIAV